MSQAIAVGFLVMGAVGFVVKLSTYPTVRLLTDCYSHNLMEEVLTFLLVQYIFLLTIYWLVRHENIGPCLREEERQMQGEGGWLRLVAEAAHEDSEELYRTQIPPYKALYLNLCIPQGVHAASTPFVLKRCQCPIPPLTRQM